MRESASGESVSRAENRRKFGVESKVFEVEMVERRGKPQVIIMESKRGVSSWVHLGLASVGFLPERLY